MQSATMCENPGLLISGSVPLTAGSLYSCMMVMERLSANSWQRARCLDSESLSSPTFAAEEVRMYMTTFGRRAFAFSFAIAFAFAFAFGKRGEKRGEARE